MIIPLKQLADLKQLGMTKGSSMQKTGELSVILHFINRHSTVFDVGACMGEWTKLVLRHCQNKVNVHLFEPVPATFAMLVQRVPNPQGSLVFNNCAVAEKEDNKHFYHYQSVPSWSTFHRRHAVEKQYDLPPPVSIPVFTTTLDLYCSRAGIEHIHFVKVDTEGGELDVVKGASKLLQQGKIDCLQFEYGGTYADAGITLRHIYEKLRSYRYDVYKIIHEGLLFMSEFPVQYENYQYSNFLAMSRSRSEQLRNGHLPAKSR